MITTLVTGADGFVGQHLVAALLERGVSVVGGIRELPPDLDTLTREAADRVRWIPFDLERRATVRDLIREADPAAVYHLAAFASAAKSVQDPVAAFRVNVIGTLFVLEELVDRAEESGVVPRLLIPGSANIYGAAARHCRPLRESCPLEPVNPYGVSKAAQEALGLQYHRAHGLPVIVTRSFNHTGPGQRPPYAAADFAQQILGLRQRDGEGVVKVGNPEIRRDFTDVRDVVRAYIELMEHGESGQVYNVCSGRSCSIRELVELLAEAAGVRYQLEVEERRLRPADVVEMVGSYERLADATGWKPRIDLRRSLADLLESLGGA